MIINENEASLFGTWFDHDIRDIINKAKLTPTNSKERIATQKYFKDEYHYASYWIQYDIIKSKKRTKAEADFYINDVLKAKFSNLANTPFMDTSGLTPYTALDDLIGEAYKSVDVNLVAPVPSTYKVTDVKTNTPEVIVNAIDVQDKMNTVATGISNIANALNPVTMFNKYKIPLIITGVVVGGVLLFLNVVEKSPTYQALVLKK